MIWSPERQGGEIAWELRGAWALAREMVVTVDDGRAFRGRVRHVAPTGAFVILACADGDWHVPVGVIRSVRKEHFHEPSGLPESPEILRPDIEPPKDQVELD